MKKEDFWNTDLEDIEKEFLGDKKVTDLPVVLMDVVPSTLTIEKFVHNIDEKINKVKK